MSEQPIDFDVRKNRKTDVTSALPARKAEDVRACSEGKTEAAVTARIVLGSVVSIRQTAKRSGKAKPSAKIITGELACSLRIGTQYEGPLTKADAQRVLDLLIARDAGTYTPPDTAATFEQVAREYLVVVEPGWGPHTVRTSKGLIESALIRGKLGTRPVVELTDRATTIPERTCIRGRQPIEVGEGLALPAEHSGPRRYEKDHLGESRAIPAIG